MDKYLINKRICDSDKNEIENNKTKKIKLDVPSKNLITKWCSLYKWLQVEWTEEKSPLFKCKLCVAAKKKNILGTDKGKPSFIICS